jgi:hypothetical protein
MAIKANGFIRHDGKVYEPDDVIEKLGEEEQARLVELGVALPFEEKKKKEVKDDPKDTYKDKTIEDMTHKELDYYASNVLQIPDEFFTKSGDKAEKIKDIEDYLAANKPPSDEDQNIEE